MNNTILKSIGILLVGIFLFSSCSEDEKKNPANLIRSIEVSAMENNALRINIHLEFHEASSYQIFYWKEGDKAHTVQTKVSQAVTSDTSTLIFLESETSYRFYVAATSGSTNVVSEEYSFETGILPPGVPTCSLITDNLHKDIPGYVLLMQSDSPGYIQIVNPNGSLVWYENMKESVIVTTFDPKTGTLACITGNHSKKAYTGKNIVVMDLFGNRLMERSSEDLYVHHDIRRLPDGNLVVVHYVPRPFDLSAYGGAKDEMVWGDGFCIMDMEGKVLSKWDCFDELNPQDDPHIMETVGITSSLDTPIKYREDWLHANSVNLDEEGNFYMSFNWRSELWKIDGKTGKVHYRVGRNGTVKLPEEGIAAGMHSVWPLEPNKVLVFDNGLASQISRGLIYEIDKNAQEAKVSLNIPLDIMYGSPYMSSVRLIQDDLLLFGGTFSKCILFVNRNGEVLRSISTPFQSYRAEYIPYFNY